MRRTIPFLALATLVASSCALITGNSVTPTEPSALDVTEFQKAFMSSYYAERSGKPGGAAVTAGGALTPLSASSSGVKALATVPVDRLSDEGTSFSSLSPSSFSNYPEPGQTTSFTATLYDENSGYPVYLIEVTTLFPSDDERASYVEGYYLEDADADAEWTIDDPVVEYSGGAWVASPAARTGMLLTFQDGSTRAETIVSTSADGGALFSPDAFGVDGSLDMDDSFVPGLAEATEALESGTKYSSVVIYYVTPAKSYDFWFWSGSSQQTILGIRYYTEVADATANSGAGAYTAYTVSFEKTVDELTTTGGDFVKTLTSVYIGSEHDTLAETVLRQEVVYDLSSATSGSTDYYVPTGTGAVTTNMLTRVVNITGQKDFYLSQMDSDQVQLSSWASSTIYSPSGDVSEILAEDSDTEVFSRSQQTTPAEGTLPFAVSSTDLAGYGDLATLYYSLITGTAGTTISDAPADSNLSGSYEYSFDGQQAAGLSIASEDLPDVSQAGTVEAWVKIDKLTDTAGIVHKGVEIDFSDECFSLQGWGSSGQIALILNPESGDYDIVKSTVNLKKNKWYYLVATWDTSTGKINLYINGSLNKSGSMTNTSGGVRANDSAIILGSQLPEEYSSVYGYFGLDGTIVGANLSGAAMSAEDVLAKYNSYKDNTSSW